MNAPIFGLHAVTAALKTGQVERLWCDQTRRDGRLRRVREQAEAAGIEYMDISRSELDRLCPTGAVHQGVVAQVAAPQSVTYRETDLPRLIEASLDTPLLLVLDGVKDPHNLGACLRSADAAGCTAVIVPADRAAGLTPTVSKVACGAQVPLVTVTNLARCLRQLQQLGCWITGLAGEAPTSLYAIDLSVPSVLVLGAEENGLRRLTREHCDQLAALPLRGRVESLNVSVAAGVSLFEAVRQRR